MTVDVAGAFGPFSAEPRRSVVIVDFDGTLAPIVEDPEKARPVPAATVALTRLARCLGRVAVVSGRPVDFLAEVLPVDGIVLVGHYGLERLEGGVRRRRHVAAPSAKAVEAAARVAETAEPGLLVERKSGIAVTFHWRRAPELEHTALRLARELAAEHELTMQRGRLSVELRPPTPVDKGTAAARLATGAQAVLLAGDDHGDVAAFEALTRLLTKQQVPHGLRVAVRSPETPPELITLADHEVDGPEGVAVFLHQLADTVLAGGR